MAGEAAPTEPWLRPPAEPLDPRVRRLWTLHGLIAAAVVAVVVAAVVTVWAVAGDPPLAVLVPVAGAIVALAVAVALVAPRIAYRVLRFEVTDQGLYLQRGWITRTWTIVPHSRIQSVASSSGPLERALGLASVEVRTASAAAARIPGLDEERIARLRHDLAALAGEGEAT